MGLDEFVAAAKKSGKYDYEMPIEGVKVLDKYTISFKLREPDYNFIYFSFTTTFTKTTKPSTQSILVKLFSSLWLSLKVL